jgi:NADPH:quinone reductase
MSSRTARAVAYSRNGPIDAPDALIDTEISVGEPTDFDLLVQVRAVSVNPVDVKLRAGRDPGAEPVVLGYDAAGTVLAVGESVRRFRPGDEVFYSGVYTRQGSDAGLQRVDARIVGHKPRNLGFAEAAAMPLTSLTAWEVLFDKLRLTAESTGSLLVMGAAGGVGSMIIQLTRALLAEIEIIGTASRQESADWARDLGASRIVDHHRLVDELGESSIDLIFSPYTDGQVVDFARILKPRGEVVAIDEPEGLDLLPLKDKSQTWHWEFMFSRPLYEPASSYQHEALEQISGLLEAGAIRHTMTSRLGTLDAASLTEAHRMVESGRMIGKVVLEVG